MWQVLAAVPQLRRLHLTLVRAGYLVGALPLAQGGQHGLSSLAGFGRALECVRFDGTAYVVVCTMLQLSMLPQLTCLTFDTNQAAALLHISALTALVQLNVEEVLGDSSSVGSTLCSAAHVQQHTATSEAIGTAVSDVWGQHLQWGDSCMRC